MKLFFYLNDKQIETVIKNNIEALIEAVDFAEKESVQILINAGKRPDFIPDTRIAIVFCADRLTSNSGQLLTGYKKKVCELLAGSNISMAVNDIIARAVPDSFANIDMDTKAKNINGNNSNSSVAMDYEEKSKQFIPTNPAYSFDRVIINDETKERILSALAILKCEDKVFKEWGLYEIQPHPSSALSFFGPSGTGKTMAAEAIASKLNKKILKVSYADVESKYHGEGPKMVKAIFLAAAREDAVLFFDEADSLLSKRLTNVLQGSEQAINSMRSELLISLENYRGIVIFATNLVVNYDKAFLTRLISIEFKLPDCETRKRIWDVHIKPVNDGKQHLLKIPLNPDVNTSVLAEKYQFSGREIRNAVISACVSAAMEDRNEVTMQDFINASEKIKNEMISVQGASDHTASGKSEDKMDFFRQAITSKMEKKEGEKNVSGDAQ